MMEAGSLECYEPGQAAKQWRSAHLPACVPREETLDEAAGRLRFALEESVALHALADAPVGAS